MFTFCELKKYLIWTSIQYCCWIEHFLPSFAIDGMNTVIYMNRLYRYTHGILLPPEDFNVCRSFINFANFC